MKEEKRKEKRNGKQRREKQTPIDNERREKKNTRRNVVSGKVYMNGAPC